VEDGRRRLRTVVIDYDTARADLIARRGYVQTPAHGYNRRRPLSGLTYMPELALGIVEPVGTHPDHVRRGLQRAVLTEGLRRVPALGAPLAIVGTGDMVPAHRFYEALGFTDAHRDWLWEKVW